MGEDWPGPASWTRHATWLLVDQDNGNPRAVVTLVPSPRKPGQLAATAEKPDTMALNSRPHFVLEIKRAERKNIKSVLDCGDDHGCTQESAALWLIRSYARPP